MPWADPGPCEGVSMRAMVMDRIGGPLEVREVPDPVPPAGGVVVQVSATGLCRSDWHAWAGHDDIALPHVPGHELAGVICAGHHGAWCPPGRAS